MGFGALLGQQALPQLPALTHCLTGGHGRRRVGFPVQEPARITHSPHRDLELLLVDQEITDAIQIEHHTKTTGRGADEEQFATRHSTQAYCAVLDH